MPRPLDPNKKILVSLRLPREVNRVVREIVGSDDEVSFTAWVVDAIEAKLAAS